MIRSIGLTGGIGSGKSTVAALLVRHGAALVDTDAIARTLTAPGGGALPALATAFGDGIVGEDGALDRARMRAIAFGDGGDAAKARLEAILHPMIGAEAERQAAAAAGRVVVFDVPLLAESARWRARVDRVLVIDCSEATQLARVVRRSGWSEDTVRAVIARQAPRGARRAVADAVIDNDAAGIDALAAEVDTLWALWCGGAGTG